PAPAGSQRGYVVPAVQDTGGHLLAVDAAQGGDHALAQAGAAAGAVQLGLIAGKLQRVAGDQVLVHLLKAALVQHQAQAVVGADGVVIAAQGADVLVFDQLPPQDGLPAVGAVLLGVAGQHRARIPQGLQAQQLVPPADKYVAHALASSSP